MTTENTPTLSEEKTVPRKKDLNIRRYVLIVLLLLIGVAVLCSRARHEKVLKDIIRMNPIPLSSIKQTREDMADVALVRSERENAREITDEEVRGMVREAVKLAGGLNAIISDGDFVVLKPNMIAAKHVSGGMLAMFDGDKYVEKKLLDPRANGIATDFRIARSVAEMVRELNPTGKIYIMETSGWGNTKRNMEILGYVPENFPMVDKIMNFDSIGIDPSKYGDELVAIDLGDKKLFKEWEKHLAHTNELYYMSKIYYSADAVIDLPVLKNHMNAGFTGAIKNVGIGVVPVRIYGNNGMLDLNRMAINHAWEPLNKWIHDYYLVKPVDFVVTDGLQGSSHGPVAIGAKSLEKAQQNMRCILAGKDALAVDAIHAYLVGTDPQQVNYMTMLAREGIGIMDPAKINVLGNASVGSIKKKFGLPGFPMSMIAPDPKRVQYNDFTAPEIRVESARLTGETLSGTVHSDKSLIKLDVYLDGKFSGAVQKNGTEIDLSYSDQGLSAARDISLRAYDKYLNTSDIKLSIK